jgi:conjugal transfer pilus assembly protein TraA
VTTLSLKPFRLSPQKTAETALLVAISGLVVMGVADAGTDTTFTPTVTRITGWTTGSLGKLAGVAGIATALVGLVAKFDWRLIGGALGIGLTASTGSTIVAGLATAVL